MSEDQEWNYDRIVTVNAMLNSVRCDMDITLHRGTSKNMRERMVKMLRFCADDLEKLRVNQ